MAILQEKRGKGQKAYLCGTPGDKCQGSVASVSHSLRKQITRTHGDRESAFVCYTRWLKAQGFTRIGAHDFASPNHGPVLMLGRKSQFGALLRPGKAGRSMPVRHGKMATTGGTIL